MFEVHTVWAALLAGGVTSLHCVGMCGPIACSTCMQKSGGSEAPIALYHGGRIVSYTIIGMICGALGRQPLSWFFDSPAVLLPWVIVLLLVALAFGWKVKMPRALGHRLGWFKLRQKIMGLGSRKGALAMGLATPFLPCGPLYLFFGVCLLTGSAWAGAEFAFAFALGTVPLLLVSQIGFSKLRQVISAGWLSRIQRVMALLAALMVAWRLVGTLPFLAGEASAQESGNEGSAEVEPANKMEQTTIHPDDKPLPSCCH